VPCPHSSCTGMLTKVRSNFSKSKTLFPMFGLNGAPTWCITIKMRCQCCQRPFWSNDADVLLAIPQCLSIQYPVEPKHALSNHSLHLEKETTEVVDSLMLAYGNGEMCSRLLYNSINRSFLDRVASYYSFHKANPKPIQVNKCIEKDGVYIKQHPPLGDTVRDMHNEASQSNNRWGTSKHDRHVRVKCTGTFAQDHTFEACKNYRKPLGAKAVWDVAVGSAASVP